MNKSNLITLINENADLVSFGDFGNGVSQDWIIAAEDRLGVSFPPSYIWWLKNYGGGEVSGQEIFSVYEMDFDKVVGGDIVYINELNRKNGTSSSAQLTIQETDQSEVLYFDLNQRDENMECPIYVRFADKSDLYAVDFLDFLAKRIQDIT